MELAIGSALVGVARLALGINVLMLLALGILVGVTLAAPAVPESPAGPTLGAWAPWAGVLALGIGFLLYRNAPPRTLPWLLLALCAERLAQLAGSWAAGPAFSSFTGGLVLPVVAAVAARRSRLPAEVIFLPSFWMLVPGAIGLAAVSRLFVTRSGGNLSDLITAIISVLAVTLGIVISSRLPAVSRGRRASAFPDAGA